MCIYNHCRHTTIGAQAPTLTLDAWACLDFQYVSELDGDGETALVFKARVGDRELHGIDLGEVDADGAITKLTVFVRPLSAAVALRDAMGARLGMKG